MSIKSDLKKYWLDHGKDEKKLAKKIDSIFILDYRMLDGFTTVDKATNLIKEWNNESMNIRILEDSLMNMFKLSNADQSRLADCIRITLSDEDWRLLNTKHKGSSEAKAWSLIHMWAKNEDMKWEGMHEVEYVDKKYTLGVLDSYVVGAEDKSIIKKDGIYYGIPTDKELEESVDKAIYERFTLPWIPLTSYQKPAGLALNSDDGHTIAEIDSTQELNSSSKQKHKGLRFNEGKLRYDLVHPWSQEQMVRVLTKGSVKYEERNWERGMKWSNVLASAKRHMAAIERGEDYDIDHNCPDCQKSTKDNWICKNHTGELHAALLQTNAHFLTAYYKIYPQGDDRPKPYLSHKKIGLDIDDVLADFVGAWLERYPQNKPNFWNFDKDIKEKFQQVATDKDFWMGIKPKIHPDELPFEPHCYITSRMIPNEWTEEWLQANGFPAVPVYTVGFNESKVEVAKESGIDIFVDDRFENFVELNNAGICTFLMDAGHNRRYDVQARRIYSLKDLM